jgi:hypothetical protein
LELIMWFALMGLPGIAQTIDDNVDTLLTRCTEARLARLDADMTSRAPASTALSDLTWTDIKAGYLDKAISSISTGQFDGKIRNSQTFNANGTFTVPTGFDGFLFVTLVGGGGGGGGGGNNDGGGGGGGGGGFCWRMPIWIRKADTTSVAVTIGTGGVAGSGQSSAGSPGGDSSFGSYITAYGGGAGGANTAANNWGQGGLGGTLSEKGANGASGSTSGGGSVGADAVINLEPLLADMFPAWQHIRNCAVVTGAGGGNGDDNLSVGGSAGDLDLPQFFVDFPFFNVGNPIVASAAGINGDGGGGGCSWKEGGDSGNAPAANGGGGGCGQDSDGTPAAQAGADGVCIVEWWTAS